MMQWVVTVGAMVVAAVSWLSQGTGGTLVVRTDTNPVQPIAIAITGPESREVPLDGAHEVVIRGLQAGRYKVEPLFAGTVTGAGLDVDVSPGTVANLALPLGGVGGVRFDADPGMCEPDFGWVFGFMTHRGPDHPDYQPTATRPLPTATTCQLEIGGLAPGDYSVRVTPTHRELPMFMTMLQVRPRLWTSIRMPRPPAVVHGRITSNGEPVPGLHVDIRSIAMAPLTGVVPLTMAYVTSLTDADGRYAIGLATPGTYRQTLREPGQAEMPGIAPEVEVLLGANINDIEIGGGALRVWLTERGATIAPDRPVTLTIQSLPQRPKRPVVSNADEPFEMRMLRPGRYMVSATMASVNAAGEPVTLVAAQQKEVVITEMTTSDVSIDLIERDEMWLDVVYADGTPAAGATVVPYPGGGSLRTDDRGRVSLATVPAGARLPVRTRNFGVTCHAVTNDVLQRVVVYDASETLLVTIAGQTTSVAGRAVLGGATVTGVPGSSCAVPFEGFSIAETRHPDRIDFKFLLPPATYTLTLLDGRSLVVAAPGRVEVK